VGKKITTRISASLFACPFYEHIVSAIPNLLSLTTFDPEKTLHFHKACIEEPLLSNNLYKVILTVQFWPGLHTNVINANDPPH